MYKYVCNLQTRYLGNKNSLIKFLIENNNLNKKTYFYKQSPTINTRKSITISITRLFEQCKRLIDSFFLI